MILDHCSLKASPGSFIPGCWLVAMVGTFQPAGQGLAHIWRFRLGPAAFRKSKVPCPSRTSWFLTLPFAERVGRKLVPLEEMVTFFRGCEMNGNCLAITASLSTSIPFDLPPENPHLDSWSRNPTTDTAQEQKLTTTSYMENLWKEMDVDFVF